MTVYASYFEPFAPNFSARHTVQERGLPAPMHFHPGYELYLCQTENMACIVNGSVYAVTKDDLLLFHSLDLHQMLPPQDRSYERYVIGFVPEFAECLNTPATNLLACFIHAPQQAVRLHLVPEQRDFIIGCCEEADKIVGSYAADVREKLLLGKLLLEINGWLRDSEPAPPPVNDEPMAAVLAYIAGHPDEELTLDALSRRFYLNKNQLNQRFSLYTGFTLHQYVFYSRMTHAKRYLLMGCSVTETAAQSGFGNLSHFIRAFRELFGCSPGEYARQYRKNGGRADHRSL